MKKSLRIMLVALFALLLLAACSEEAAEKSDEEAVPVNDEGFPIVDEEIKLSLIAPGTGMAEWKDMPTLQKYSEMTNINFDYKTPPMSDFKTKLNLAFASGDIEDIIYAAGTSNLTPAMEVDYGKQGVLLPLEDLIAEHAPNIQKMFEENPAIKKSVTTVDGHIYSLPRVSKGDTAIWYRGPMWYNGTWLEALDVKELPKTTEEFYELLKRFKTEDPNGNGKADEIPLTDVKMDSTRPWLLGAFGLKEWGIEEVDGNVRYTPIQPEYKEYLKYMNKLYEEELLDQEVFAQSDEQKKAKGKANRVGVFPDYFSFFTLGETPEKALNDPMFFPLTSSVSDEPLVPRSTGINRGNFSITKNNPNPAASIRWVDYFYSQEGYEFLNRGPEGHLWSWVDEEGGAKKENPLPDGFESLEDYRGTLTPDYGINTPALTGPIEGMEKSEFDKFISSETSDKIEPYAEVPYPLVYLKGEEQEEVSRIQADLETYVRQMEAKFITGVEPLSNWDKYVQTIKDMNVESLVKIHQEAYDRWENN
ncbi:extracellular solute-binding protein [Virgibacillus necropolis]|uniref:extracellular solute-binding protein n=1 Tax=Virgibacillus necropolis TaxID=163877 RepID=UPI0026C2B983|nr:extracellular solute-binding protein [Virgibacillus necropolis]